MVYSSTSITTSSSWSRSLLAWVQWAPPAAGSPTSIRPNVVRRDSAHWVASWKWAMTPDLGRQRRHNETDETREMREDLKRQRGGRPPIHISAPRLTTLEASTPLVVMFQRICPGDHCTAVFAALSLIYLFHLHISLLVTLVLHYWTLLIHISLWYCPCVILHMKWYLCSI